MRRLVPALATLLLVASPDLAQGRFDNVQIESQEVAGSVWMLKGAGGNLAVSVGEDGVFLVDDQFAPLTDKIRAAIGEIDKGEIRFVINTHWHGDHTGGNENLGKAGSVIVAHEHVRRRMSVEQRRGDRTIGPSPRAALPVITFEDEVTFHLNGDTLHAWHPAERGHTDGDSVIHFRKANVIHCGDLYFQGMYPFIDQNSGGDIRGAIESIDGILSLTDADTRLIPGHGGLSNPAEMREYRAMLQGVHDAVAALVRAGKTEDEAVAEAPTAPWDEVWGGGFINPETFTRHVYRMLAAD